jgi:MFS transporter, MHS family, proline/betaine transporter
VVASTHAVATETTPARWRGTASDFIGGGVGMGALIASVIYYITSSVFPGAAFATWAGVSCSSLAF